VFAVGLLPRHLGAGLHGVDRAPRRHADRREPHDPERPDDGNWFIIESRIGGVRVQQWGTLAGVPVP